MDRNRLIDAGINYDEGVERFGGQAALFEKYLVKFFEDGLMQKIEAELENKDIAGAFRTTHDLKGASGNLSINSLYVALCELTDRLRGGSPSEDYGSELSKVMMLYNTAKDAVCG